MDTESWQNQPIAPPGQAVYSVTRLNREARSLLEDHLGRVWVEGEIADLSRPSSGHWYFVIKDQGAQVRCALFRGAQRLCCPAANGLKVLLYARVSVYEGRGEFQLIVEQMQNAGEGALRRAFDALKLRLENEGLFAASRKRPLPRLVRRIAVITSPDGAALHDILTTLKRRFPGIGVLLYPVLVQGPQAAPSIVEALTLASTRQECDVILLARGGGSLEDLWPFNEESVARAISQSPLPVVSGVGHEVDVTIADLVADVRAPTPTAAAELLSPDRTDWQRRHRAIYDRLIRLSERTIRERTQRLDDMRRRLVRPSLFILARREQVMVYRSRLERALPAYKQALMTRWLKLQHRLTMCSPRQQLALQRARWLAVTMRLESVLKDEIARYKERLTNGSRRLLQRTPAGYLAPLQIRTQRLYNRLLEGMVRYLDGRNHTLAQLRQALLLVGPQAVLGRGYAIVRRPTGEIIQNAAQVDAGDKLLVRLAIGEIQVEVQSPPTHSAP